MRHIAIENLPLEIQWFDQRQFHFYVLVNEATGEVGMPDIMQSIDADLQNIGLRLAESSWRWFKFEEMENAS